MGFINKIKNFFYDEEEVEEEVTPKKVEQVKKKKHVIEDDREEQVSERELFRSERTFNFPVDVEEEDFKPVTTRIKEEKNVNNNNIEVHKEYKSSRKEEVRKPYSYIKPEKKEEKKFKPTPVISPVFGILDENYKAEPSVNSLEETREFNISRRVTFDEIHRKAYGNPKVIKPNMDDEQDEDIEEREDVKSIFYNLKDETEIEKEDIDDSSDDEIKITYNDVDFDDEDNNDEIEVPKISRIKKNVEKDDTDNDDDILSETKEQDLFNLIDNMYNSDEEEEDE